MKKIIYRDGLKLIPNERLTEHLSNRPMWNSAEISFYSQAEYLEIGGYKEGEGYLLRTPSGGFTGCIPHDVVHSMEHYED